MGLLLCSTELAEDVGFERSGCLLERVPTSRALSIISRARCVVGAEVGDLGEFGVAGTLEPVAPDGLPEFVFRFLEFALFFQDDSEVVVGLGVLGSRVWLRVVRATARRRCSSASANLACRASPNADDRIDAEVGRVASQGLLVIGHGVDDSVVELFESQADQVELFDGLVFGGWFRIFHQLG